MSPQEGLSENRPLPSARRSEVDAVTSLLFTITLMPSMGLEAVAAGTRLSRALARRHER